MIDASNTAPGKTDEVPDEFKILIDIRNPQAINSIGRTITEILSTFANDIHISGVAYVDHLRPENREATRVAGMLSPNVVVTLTVDLNYHNGTVSVTGTMSKPYMRPVRVPRTLTLKAIDNTPGK